MSETLKFGNGEWATKEGYTLAYNDENGNFKPLPFDFSRSTSATRVNKEGLIELVSNNEPRIDFLNDSDGALLLEPQRTNSFQQSNQFDTNWQVSSAGVSVTPNQVGVGGSTDAWKLTEGTFNSEHFIRQTPNVGGVVSISVYAKAGTNDFVYLRGVTGGANKRTWFNLSNGTVGTSQGISAEMISMGNGWYRCVMVLDHQTAFEYYIATSKANGVSSYQGDNGFIYIQNSQVEQGSYATSYIPTQGSIGTRVGESCSQTPPSGIIGQTEGTMFVDIDVINLDPLLGSRIILSDGTTNNYIFIGINDSPNLPRLFVNNFSSSFTLSLFSSTSITLGHHKLAIKYKSGSFALFLDGNIVASSSAVGTIPSTSQLILGGSSPSDPSAKETLTINSSAIFPTALTDQELINLTTI